MIDRIASQSGSSQSAITLDIDWAPDFAIDFAADMLIESDVRATWFATHDCPALSRLQSRSDLFEIGIHPNFLTGTTHGSNESEILRHCLQFAPGATTVRTHGLVQSSNLLKRILDETPVRVDASLFLPHANFVTPIEYFWEDGKRLVRLPYVWEDDFEMVRPNPRWDLLGMIREGAGVMIFNFHPIHIYLNSSNLTAYREIRSLGRIQDLTRSAADKFVGSDQGARSAFISAVEAGALGKSATIGDIAATWKY